MKKPKFNAGRRVIVKNNDEFFVGLILVVHVYDYENSSAIEYFVSDDDPDGIGGRYTEESIYTNEGEVMEEFEKMYQNKRKQLKKLINDMNSEEQQ